MAGMWDGRLCQHGIDVSVTDCVHCGYLAQKGITNVGIHYTRYVQRGRDEERSDHVADSGER